MSSTKWRKLEKAVASDINGRLVSGSGSKLHAKGDVRSDVWLVECKSSEDLSLRLEFSWLDTIKQYARAIDKDWALAVCPNITYVEDYFVFVDEGMQEFIDDTPEELEIQGEKGMQIPIEGMSMLLGPWKVKGKPWLIMNRKDFRRLDSQLRN